MLKNRRFAVCFIIYSTRGCRYVYLFRKGLFVIARTIHSGIEKYKNVAIEFFFYLSFANIYNGLIRDVYHFNKP